jgi:hypothetical protein
VGIGVCSYQWFLLGLLGIAIVIRISAWATNRLNRVPIRDAELNGAAPTPRGTLTRARDVLVALFSPLCRPLEPLTSNSAIKVVTFLAVILVNVVFCFVCGLVSPTFDFVSFHLTSFV